LRNVFGMLVVAALAAAPAAAAPQHASAPATHYTHPAAPHAAPISRAPVPHTAPDKFHPASKPNQPVHEYTPKVTRNVKITSSQTYKDVTSYHINKYHTTVNVTYAGHPGSDHGSWRYSGQVRWYDGYWHDYWTNEQWTNWGGHYGFWLNLDGLNFFVYEYSPGVCWYWNGYEWTPWWNPPFTPYYCPY